MLFQISIWNTPYYPNSKSDSSLHVTKKFIQIPSALTDILTHLTNKGARPIIVGGFVRDALLGIPLRKDIDIEVYNIDSYEYLAEILSRFGSVCIVGRSFGVCKLHVGGLECDFSLPRKENKIAKGHKGFKVTIDPTLSFKEAAKRRDFTINSLGYDPVQNRLLDEYEGITDIKNKTLRAVNPETFQEDPLRVLRGVVFAARFGFHFHHTLTFLCQKMIKRNMLEELPKERVFEEFKKLFFKSKKPSRAILLLKHLQEHLYLNELFSLPRKKFIHTINAIDHLACHSEKSLPHFFAALLFYLPNKTEVLQRFTNDKKVMKNTLELLENHNVLLTLLTNGYSELDLKLAATKMSIEDTLRLLSVLYHSLQKGIEDMREEAKSIGVLYTPLAPRITGKDLLAAGLKPSKTFKKILKELYLLQLQNERVDENFLQDYLRTNGYID